MLRTNLSTRPFYNERAAHIAIGIAAVLVLAITASNAVRIVSLSRQNTELSTRVTQEQAEVRRLNEQAAEVRRAIDRDELERIVAAAQEANALIDQRTFSWTAFFNRIETTIPADVMLTSVRPSVHAGETRVTLQVLAQGAADIDEFMENLESTGAFASVVPSQQDVTEQGLYRATIDSTYAEPRAAPESAPAPATRAGAAPRTGRSRP